MGSDYLELGLRLAMATEELVHPSADVRLRNRTGWAFRIPVLAIMAIKRMMGERSSLASQRCLATEEDEWTFRAEVRAEARREEWRAAFLSHRQCCILQLRLKTTADRLNRSGALVHVSPTAPIRKEYYRVVLNASCLLSSCRQEASSNSAVMLLDAHQAFKAALSDLEFCLLVLLPRNDLLGAANRIQNYVEIAESEWKRELEVASYLDQDTLRLKLIQDEARFCRLQIYVLTALKTLLHVPYQDGRLPWFAAADDPGATIGKYLGQGSYGSVYKFTWFGLECAKKSFICTTEEHKREFQKEAGVMAYLNHPHVVKFICCQRHEDSKEWAIVMEYMPMNLQEFIDQHVDSSHTRKFPFTPMAALHIISQIASGMDYLHRQDVVHRDLKPNNILVSPIDDTDLAADGYGDVKLCDFGLAKLKLTSQTEEQSRVCGARYWRAPEAYPKEEGGLPRYRAKEADAYSFAIVCSQILSGTSCPFPDPCCKLTERISAPRNERPHLPSDTYPPKLLDLINDCWDPNPERRPSFSDICKTLQEIKLVLLAEHTDS
ncbi:unnamed protein product [Sphagnum compactum]